MRESNSALTAAFGSDQFVGPGSGCEAACPMTSIAGSVHRICACDHDRLWRRAARRQRRERHRLGGNRFDRTHSRPSRAQAQASTAARRRFTLAEETREQSADGAAAERRPAAPAQRSATGSRPWRLRSRQAACRSRADATSSHRGRGARAGPAFMRGQARTLPVSICTKALEL